MPAGEDANGPRFNGYQLLAHLLYTKHEFLDADIIEVVFEWIGMGQMQRERPEKGFASETTRAARSESRERKREARNKERQDDRTAAREATAATDGGGGGGEQSCRGGVLGNSSVFRHILLELHLWNNSVGMLQMVFQRIAGLVSTIISTTSIICTGA